MTDHDKTQRGVSEVESCMKSFAPMIPRTTLPDFRPTCVRIPNPDNRAANRLVIRFVMAKLKAATHRLRKRIRRMGASRLARSEMIHAVITMAWVGQASGGNPRLAAKAESIEPDELVESAALKSGRHGIKFGWRWIRPLEMTAMDKLCFASDETLLPQEKLDELDKQKRGFLGGYRALGIPALAGGKGRRRGAKREGTQLLAIHVRSGPGRSQRGHRQLEEVHGKLQSDGSTFHTTVPTNYPDMIKTLRDKGVNISVRDANSWPDGLMNLVPLILFAMLWFFMNRQWQTAFGKLISPMRQAWINELRKEIASLSSSALQYFETGYEARKDEEYKRLTELELEVILTVNPHENDHVHLLATIREMIKALERGKGNENEFMGAYKKMTEVARTILSTEWNRV